MITAPLAPRPRSVEAAYKQEAVVALVRLAAREVLLAAARRPQVEAYSSLAVEYPRQVEAEVGAKDQVAVFCPL